MCNVNVLYFHIVEFSRETVGTRADSISDNVLYAYGDSSAPASRQTGRNLKASFSVWRQDWVEL